MRREVINFMMRYPLICLAIVAAVAVGSIALLVRDDGIKSDEPYKIAAADEPLFTSKWDDELLSLEKQAVNNGYRQKAEDLIRVWFLDETGQPARFLTGVRAARKKYIDMMNAIDKREKDLETLRKIGADKK
jgi:hypothetical protein